MNKVIVSNKKNSINGNNALAPDYTPSRHEDTQRYKELHKSKNEYNKKRKRKQILYKTKVLRNILITFIIGITLVYRYSALYNMEKNISEVKHEINKINAENENIRIKLLKYTNIQSIERKAKYELEMIYPSKVNTIYIDLKKNNFNEIIEEQKEKKNSTIVEKIKSILFTGGKNSENKGI